MAPNTSPNPKKSPPNPLKNDPIRRRKNLNHTGERSMPNTGRRMPWPYGAAFSKRELKKRFEESRSPFAGNSSSAETVFNPQARQGVRVSDSPNDRIETILTPSLTKRLSEAESARRHIAGGYSCGPINGATQSIV